MSQHYFTYFPKISVMNIETDTGIDFKKLTPTQPRCMVDQLLIRNVNSP